MKILIRLVVLLISSFAGAVIELPENATIPAVIFFRDSAVDTGNNNYINDTLAKGNFRPYGKNFIGGKPTGRFSDGKLPSDLFVEELGIKPLLPPYLDPSLQDQDLLTGVNFASSASGYDPLTSQLMKVFSMSDQLEMFKEYIVKLKKIAGEEKSSTILRQSIIAVATGSNDIWNTYFNERHFQYDISTYIDILVRYASTFAQDLYGLGARRIGVFGMPPIGCMPSQRTLKGGLERKCVDQYNQIVQLFNDRLSAEIASLNTQFPDANMVYVDFYSLPLDIIRNPRNYGFKIVDRGCCGSGTLEASIFCRYACSNDDDYMFWDSFHPTEKAYRILVHQMLEKYINYFVCGKSLC